MVSSIWDQRLELSRLLALKRSDRPRTTQPPRKRNKAAGERSKRRSVKRGDTDNALNLREARPINPVRESASPQSKN